MNHLAAVYELRDLIRVNIPVGSWQYHRARELVGALKNEIERLKQDEVRRMGT